MTDNTGIKISLPGFDVKTATPEQCSVHSVYDSMKVKIDNQNPQEGNILLTFNSNPPAETQTLYSVHHGFNYIPACYLFFDIVGSSANVGQEVGNIIPFDALSDLTLQLIPDTQNVTFKLVSNGLNTSVAGNHYAFRYYIFANDGI